MVRCQHWNVPVDGPADRQPCRPPATQRLLVCSREPALEHRSFRHAVRDGGGNAGWCALPPIGSAPSGEGPLGPTYAAPIGYDASSPFGDKGPGSLGGHTFGDLSPDPVGPSIQWNHGPQVTFDIPIQKVSSSVPSQGAQSRDYDLSFNGTTLELYGEEGGIAGKWEGVSGRPGFQDPAYQWLPDKGPLPEGYYLARQSRLEQFPTGLRGAAQEALGLVGRGQWPGGRIAWGDYRVWLEPIRGTDPLGRSGFSIHGGLFPGTRGCIDLCGGMSSFVDAFRATGRDLVLRVQYPGGP